MKIKMKKVISFVLVMLILLSNSPISLAMGKDSFDQYIKESESAIASNIQETKEDSLDNKINNESKTNLLDIKNNEELIKGTFANIFETSKELFQTNFYENNEVEKNINDEKKSVAVQKEDLKEEYTKIDELKEFTLNYSSDEKKLISKFEKIIEDKSNERHLTYEDALELKEKFDIKDNDDNSPKYVDISNIEIKDGYLFIDFYKNSDSEIKKIEIEVAKELSLEEEIYLGKEVESAKNILKELAELEKSIEKFKGIDKLQKESNNLEDELKKLYDKKYELIQSLDNIKASYNIKDYGFKSLNEQSILKDKIDNVSLTPENLNTFDDFTLAFKPRSKEVSSTDILKVSIEGDSGKQVIILKNNEFEENNNINDLIPRSRANSFYQVEKVPNLQKQKTIDYLGDKVKNPDTNIQEIKSPEEIADSYRIYLDVSSETQAEKNGIDLVVVVDRSGSMRQEDMKFGNRFNQPRYKVVDYFLNGSNGYNGFINNFLNQNPKNNISVIDFGGIPYPYGRDDASILQDWTNNVTNVQIYQPGNEGTNYDAGLKLAEEQFSKKENSENSKVMLFLSDGVPTYYVDEYGRRRGDGRIYNTNRHNDNENIVRRQMLDYNIPNFYENNSDIRTIAVGVSKDINSTNVGSSMSPDVLRKMADLSGGVFLGIEENIDELTSKLANEVLYAVSKVKITDTLSKHVKLDSKADFKVTVRDTSGNIKTLWKEGKQTPENENGKYIQSLEVKKVNGEENVVLTFNPDYKLDKNLKFSLSYNVTVPKETFKEYQEKGYSHRGDLNTDYVENKTSSGRGGFYSNSKAHVDFAFGPEEKTYKEFYAHPVVQVELQNLSIKKVDYSGKVLEKAKFSIYKDNPNVNTQAQPLELYDNEALSGNKKIEFTSNDKGDIKIYGLVHGTYYLKEIEAPEGFSKIEKPLKVQVSRLGKVSIEEDDNFSLDNNTVIVKNELMGGYELPITGSSGTTLFRFIGFSLISTSIIFYCRKRQYKC